MTYFLKFSFQYITIEVIRKTTKMKTKFTLNEKLIIIDLNYDSRVIRNLPY